MELPIDHFRLLGVSPTTDAQNVLRTLQQRLDRTPDQGFTQETLKAREALLRNSADLLCDLERRQLYESQLTALTESGQSLQAGLDVPNSQEVAGLLLLQEAGLHLDVFELVSRALQPPQAPAMGSGREADLGLLVGMACRAGAAELRQQRLYESAARLLLQGQQLLQRIGQHPQERQAIQTALLGLRPFRVLDLISRDLGDSGARSEGLQLLEELVRDRGGLEGYGDPQLSPEEFEAFFRQIRAYLTVQEQIDLFSRWAKLPGPGAVRADGLATTALAASGFAQRKPERIAAALDRLLTSSQPNQQRQLACLHLLLGHVDAAEAAFADPSAAGPLTSTRAAEWTGERAADQDLLAALCGHCRNWLAREVLPGYRDLEADPDLEAYFADRDVQAYIDENEPMPEPPAPASSAPQGMFGLASSALFGLSSFGDTLREEREAPVLMSNPNSAGDWAEDGSPPDWDWQERLSSVPRPILITAAGAAAALLAVAGVHLLQPRSAPTPLAVEPQAQTPTSPKPVPAPTTPSSGAAKPPVSTATTLPLTTPSPTREQVQALLEGWLEAKAEVLAGRNSPTPLEKLARDNQVTRLKGERRDDTAQYQTQQIQTRITDLTLESRSPNRIVALVTIDYSDQRLNASGQPLGQPSRIPALRNRYVFGRDQGTWRLVTFSRAN